MAETKEQEAGPEKDTDQEQEDSERQEQASGEEKEKGPAQQQEEESDYNKAGEQDDNSKAHLIAHLKDTHALEVQSIRQLERAVQILEEEESDMAEGYQKHLEESQEHEQKIKDRIESYDLKPSAVKDLTMRAGEIGLRQIADIHPDTPVKLAMHFYAFEHLEIATYEFLARIADAADDNETAEAAKEILEQEREAAEKVAETFDKSAEMMLEREPPTDPEDLPEGEDEDSDDDSEGSDTEGHSSEDEGGDEEDRSDKDEDEEEDKDAEARSGEGQDEDEGEDKDEDESDEEEVGEQKHPLAGEKRPAG